jgi:hypothetical protein
VDVALADSLAPPQLGGALETFGKEPSANQIDRAAPEATFSGRREGGPSCWIDSEHHGVDYSGSGGHSVAATSTICSAPCEGGG